MKNFLLFLSAVFTFLFCTSSVNGALFPQEGVGVGYCLQQSDFLELTEEETSMGLILPVTSKMPEHPMAFEDAQSLARQLRMFSRGQRQLVLHYTWVDRALLCKVVKNCMDALYLSSNHTYSSLPYQSWGVSSEHYIFGMRRILI